MNKDRDSVDAAIDRAVRDMLAVEPRPGMRQRVLARINEPQRRPALWPMLAGATALAAIVTIALLNRSQQSAIVAPPVAPPVVVATREPAAEPKPAIPVAPPTATPAAPPRPPRASARPAPERRMVQATVYTAPAEPFDVVPEITEMNPIRVAAIAANQEIGGKEISVTLLHMPEITVEPIVPREGGAY